MILDKSIDAIVASDVEELVSTRVGESRKLEYKETLPEKNDAAKKEFLADVASFANSGGGIILFGMKDARARKHEISTAPQIIGLDSNLDRDKETLRLQQIIHGGIAPRVIAAIRFLDLPDGKTISIVRISASWAAPHMVTFDGNQKFFARNSAGKYPLDVMEIRRAFVDSESLGKKIDDFVLARFARIVADEMPVIMTGGPRLIVHLVPIPAMWQGSLIDIKALQFDLWYKLAPSMNSFSLDYRYNFDGFVVMNGIAKSPDKFAYTQVFRNGAIEFVYAFDPPDHDGRPKILHLTNLEDRIVEILDKYLPYYKTSGVDLPAEARVSFYKIQGYYCESNNITTGGFRSREIERNELLIPGVLFEEFDQSAAIQMRPAFDIVWNACGMIGSPNYEASGRRNPQPY